MNKSKKLLMGLVYIYISIVALSAVEYVKENHLAEPAKRTSTLVQNMYLGNLDNPEEKMKVDIFVQNRRVLDKNKLTGFTKRYAVDLKKKVPSLTNVNVGIYRLYGAGTGGRFVDLIVAYEVYFCKTKLGSYVYVWKETVDYNAEKDEKGNWPSAWEQSDTFYDFDKLTEWLKTDAKKYDPKEEAVSILEQRFF